MNPIMRYFFNLFKLSNRALQTILGGHPEVPLSARAGYWAEKGYRRGKVLAWIINTIFRDPGHCAHAYEVEDDSLIKYAADAEGRVLPLVAVALLVGLPVYLNWDRLKGLL